MSITANLWPSGLGPSLGADYATAEPLYFSGSVYYVDSAVGSDTLDGTERKQPKATLSSAMTKSNADSGTLWDIIVLESGHTETLTSGLTVPKNMMIVGGGRSSGKPTVKLKMNSSSAVLLTVAQANVELHNIWFEEDSQANGAANAVAVSAAYFRMQDCYVELGDNSNYSTSFLQLSSGADKASFIDTTFVSTGDTITSTLCTPIRTSATTSDVLLDGCVFDGGTVGFEDGIGLNVSSQINRLAVRNTSLLRGADIRMVDDSTGYVNPSTQTGGARVYCFTGE